jgi:hypothetical protein
MHFHRTQGAEGAIITSQPRHARAVVNWGTMNIHSPGMVDEDNLDPFTDHVRSNRLTKLAEKSIAGLFGELGGGGKRRTDSQIGHLRGLIEAVSEYFNVEVRILLEERKPNADTKLDQGIRFVPDGTQRRNGINKNSGMVVCIHCPRH